MNFFKRLRCKHEYKMQECNLIDGCMRKAQFLKCCKCGKERMKIL